MACGKPAGAGPGHPGHWVQPTFLLDAPLPGVLDFSLTMERRHRHIKLRIAAITIALCLWSISALLPVSCRAAGLIPPIDKPVEMQTWHYLGPFSAGPRESAFGAQSPESLRPDSSAIYPSTLVQGGMVGWRRADTDSTGWVEIEFPDVPWDTLMDIYGYAGIVNRAYACCEFDMPARRRALIEAELVGAFWLNGREFPGDPYGHGFMRVPVILEEGTNLITVALSGYGDHTFKLAVLPVPGPAMFIDDYTLPDIPHGEHGLFHAGIPVLNTTSRRLQSIVVSAGDGVSSGRTRATIRNLEALCVEKIPVLIDVITCPDSGDVLEVPITLNTGAYVYHDTLGLRVRREGQSVRRTFISTIDSSCQYYAVLPPSDFQAGRSYALILTLHGANVKAEGQADAYRAKPWAYVVAPTNRRRYGFDWQDWGRLDALEVLSIAKASLPVDTNRVYLTGHSMGGHGAWHVGLSHPDLFAAMAPAAGWTCFELYIPWFLQKAYIYGEPGERGVREKALRQDWAHDFLENARNLPVFLLQGGSDDNVPPFHSRLLASRLHELGYAYRYKEDPGRGHWYRIDSLDVACVDDPDLMGFLEGETKEAYPRDVVFKTVNPSHSRRAYWLELTEQETPYRESTIEAHVKSDTVLIATCNVRSFRITLSRELIPSGRGVVEIEGIAHHLGFGRQETFCFSRRGGEMRLGENRRSGLGKKPALYGPIKQATFSPFTIVYGTSGEPQVDGVLLHLARLEAFRWWRRGNGFVKVMPDSEVSPEIMAQRNLLLFGGPGENSIVRRMARDLPIRNEPGGIVLGGTDIHGESLAYRFVYPNPLAPDRLVAVSAGTDPEALSLLTAMPATYAGAGLPDFVIFDSEVRRLGWGGVIAAGFFDSAWRVDAALMYYRNLRKGAMGSLGFKPA
jgi:dienelactone hydrolase